MPTTIRPAGPADIPQITAIATAAYAPYIERMGREPAPMVADFHAHVRRREGHVLEDDHEIVAYLITYQKGGSQFIENVAVHPNRQGQGFGNCLLAVVEDLALCGGLDRVFLYTNVKMTENLDFYAHLGYVETHRIIEDGFERVYMEKRLIS